MKLNFALVGRLFGPTSARRRLLVLYEQKKFEVHFYLNELAVHTFILEGQQTTLVEEYRFSERHTKLYGMCSEAIQDLAKLTDDLALDKLEDIADYVRKLNRYKLIRTYRSSGFHYQLSNN